MKNKIFLLITLLFLSNCIEKHRFYGYNVDNSKIESLKNNISTKSDVINSLGSPSFKNMYDEEKWFYYGSEMSSVAFMPYKETKRNIIAIVFNKNDTLKEISRLDLSDGKDLTLNDEATNYQGTSSSPVKRFINNLGKFGDHGSKEKKRSPKGI